MWPNPQETGDFLTHLLKKSLMENFIFCALLILSKEYLYKEYKNTCLFSLRIHLVFTNFQKLVLVVASLDQSKRLYDNTEVYLRLCKIAMTDICFLQKQLPDFCTKVFFYIYN